MVFSTSPRVKTIQQSITHQRFAIEQIELDLKWNKLIDDEEIDDTRINWRREERKKANGFTIEKRLMRQLKRRVKRLAHLRLLLATTEIYDATPLPDVLSKIISFLI
jgi:hypothetical protein